MSHLLDSGRDYCGAGSKAAGSVERREEVIREESLSPKILLPQPTYHNGRECSVDRREEIVVEEVLSHKILISQLCVENGRAEKIECQNLSVSDAASVKYSSIRGHMDNDASVKMYSVKTEDSRASQDFECLDDSVFPPRDENSFSRTPNADDSLKVSDSKPLYVTADGLPSPELVPTLEPEYSASSSDSDESFVKKPHPLSTFWNRTLEVRPTSVLKGFSRHHALRLLRSISNERPSSVPPSRSDQSITIQSEDTTVSGDEVDKPPDSGPINFDVWGDDLWSDEDCRKNTVRDCYVRVNEPQFTRNVTTKRCALSVVVFLFLIIARLSVYAHLLADRCNARFSYCHSMSSVCL